MIQELKKKAADHWRAYLPTKWANLMRTDSLDLELNRAAREAASEIRTLMDRGARLDEAEEIVLPQLIYLEPETDGLDEEQRAEDAEIEAEYQRTTGIPMANLYKGMEEG